MVEITRRQEALVGLAAASASRLVLDGVAIGEISTGSLAIALQMGRVTRDEVRRVFDLDPIEELCRPFEFKGTFETYFVNRPMLRVMSGRRPYSKGFRRHIRRTKSAERRARHG